MGRQIDDPGTHGGKRWIKGTTKKGTGDADLTLPNGKNLKVEVKIKGDRPRPEQIAMQQRVRKTGAHYEFISSMVQFYEIYDRIMEPELFR